MEADAEKKAETEAKAKKEAEEKEELLDRKLTQSERLMAAVNSDFTALDIGSGSTKAIDLFKAVYLGAPFYIHDIGLPISDINLTWDQVCQKKYNVITCLNTLEHIYNPVAFLNKLVPLLKDNGCIIISVPDLFMCSTLIPLNETMTRLILEDKASTEQFARYLERVGWFNNFTELIMPGMTIDLITPSDNLTKLKNKLIEENREAIEKGDYVAYVDNVETPLLAAAKAEFKDDPGRLS